MPASWDIAIAVAFVVGLLLFGIGTSMLRALSVPVAPGKFVTWPRLVDETLTETDRRLRLDIIERLSIVGEPWCADILRQALKEEVDAGVKSAISDALSSAHTA